MTRTTGASKSNSGTRDVVDPQRKRRKNEVPPAGDQLPSLLHCVRCPRLRDHCREVAETKRKAYQDEEYWGRPVPNFGDPRARLVLVGLAPAAHGANRTGRMFTGDRSGEWLYRALHTAGFANQPESISRDDGLVLRDCLITAAAHCAPPDNRPTREELAECSGYLTTTLGQTQPRVIIALGQIAWDAVWVWGRDQFGWSKKPKFKHAAEVDVPGFNDQHLTLIGSYHPSQQNTFTGRLTIPMFDAVFAAAKKVLDEA